MEAKLINGRIALITDDYDEFGEFHKTERMITPEIAARLARELVKCVAASQQPNPADPKTGG